MTGKLETVTATGAGLREMTFEVKSEFTFPRAEVDEWKPAGEIREFKEHTKRPVHLTREDINPKERITYE